MLKLGTKENVDVRKIWSDEARDFTPWLSQEENISKLSQDLGMDLVVEAIEKEVGGYRADIVCIDQETNNRIVIENQLERFNHNHLGQAQSYASGLNANTIIWVATDFSDQHRSTIDWLNQISDKKHNFFGIKLNAFKIGNSLVAPDFDVVCKPNNWKKNINSKSKDKLTDTQKLQLDFWTRMNDFIIQKKVNISKREPIAGHWKNYGAGISGVEFATILNTTKDNIRTELVIKDENFYNFLEPKRDEIDEEFDQSLIWINLENNDHSKILLSKFDCPFGDKERWEEYREWFLAKLIQMQKVFAKHIQDYKQNKIVKLKAA